MSIVKLLLGILLPPLGIFLTVGPSPALLINILLTLLGWLPGVIHFVWVYQKQAEGANA